MKSEDRGHFWEKTWTNEYRNMTDAPIQGMRLTEWFDGYKYDMKGYMALRVTRSQLNWTPTALSHHLDRNIKSVNIFQKNSGVNSKLRSSKSVLEDYSGPACSTLCVSELPHSSLRTFTLKNGRLVLPSLRGRKSQSKLLYCPSVVEQAIKLNLVRRIYLSSKNTY